MAQTHKQSQPCISTSCPWPLCFAQVHATAGAHVRDEWLVRRPFVLPVEARGSVGVGELQLLLMENSFDSMIS